MEFLLLILQLLLFTHIPIWSSCLSLNSAATTYPPIQSAAAPLSLPLTSPTTPLTASMAAFSPGTGSGFASVEHRMDSKKRSLMVVLAASAALCGIIIVSLLSAWVYQRRRTYKAHEEKTLNSDAEKDPAFGPILGKFNLPKMPSKKRPVALIDYKQLETGTDNFQESNIVGEGGFGCVYRGRLDGNLQVAVKKLDGGGQDARREFENEVNFLCKLRHFNVISLLGYCVHKETRFIVYELMQNGSLETQLHGPTKGAALPWRMRMKIALDTARGLEYLHEYCNPPVIHRDLKSSNILLDSNFNAKLSDFGFALISGTQHDDDTKLSGTLGYVAPEYLLDGKLTDKSDVYAFGIVLLELLLGKKPVEKVASTQCQSIVTWAMPQLTDRSQLPNILDPVIRNTMDLKHLYQVAAVAVLCVQPEPSYRPLITDVLHSLIPLVPVELGGTLRVTQATPS